MLFQLIGVFYNWGYELLKYLEQFIPCGILIFLGGAIELCIVFWVIPTFRANVIPAEPLFVLATQGLFWAGASFVICGIAFIMVDSLTAIVERNSYKY